MRYYLHVEYREINLPAFIFVEVIYFSQTVYAFKPRGSTQPVNEQTTEQPNYIRKPTNFTQMVKYS